MKTLKMLFIVFVLVVSSCENNENITHSEYNSKKESNLLNEKETLDSFKNLAMEVECKGTCNDCTIIVSLTTGIGQCGCNDCRLIVTLKNSLGKELEKNNQELIFKSLTNLEFYKSSLKSLSDYQLRKYGKSSDRIEKISFFSNGEIIAVMFEFINPNGETKSVMYSQVIEDNVISGKKFEIVCDGACGCKEIFNFNNGTASCSCNDCKMTVTEIKSITEN
jgi:hypothetical protein